MSILGNFPAAPAEELPEGIVGYLYYNNGAKLPLTKVELMPDVVTLYRTFTCSGTPVHAYATSSYLHVITSDGYVRRVSLENGSVLESFYIGASLDACSVAASTYWCYAYTRNGVHYLIGSDGFNEIAWTCTEHTSKIISCDGSFNKAISADESGTVMFHESSWDSTNKVYPHIRLWSISLPGCSMVRVGYANSIYSGIAVVGSTIKLLSILDGSVLHETDIGRTIANITDNDYVYCEDGYVGKLDYSMAKLTDADGTITGYTGTLTITDVHQFEKEVTCLIESGSSYVICYVDGSVVRTSKDFAVEEWSYADNASPPILAYTISFNQGGIPGIAIMRLDGTVEFLAQQLDRVKVYFKEEA